MVVFGSAEKLPNLFFLLYSFFFILLESKNIGNIVADFLFF